MKTCTVLIPAWRCENYIIDCVKSVRSQTEHPGWTYDVRIAVDACPDTARVLQQAGIDFYYSSRNVGPYVLRNTMTALHPSEAFAYFDADDWMLPGYLSASLEALETCDLVMTGKYQLKSGSRKPIPPEKGGAMTYTAELVQTLGGFAPERVAADSDFLIRAGRAGFLHRNINTPLYVRRLHSNSLTRGGSHRYGSPARIEAWERMTKYRDTQGNYIKPVTTEFAPPPHFTKVSKKTPRKRLLL